MAEAERPPHGTARCRRPAGGSSGPYFTGASEAPGGGGAGWPGGSGAPREGGASTWGAAAGPPLISPPPGGSAGPTRAARVGAARGAAPSSRRPRPQLQAGYPGLTGLGPGAGGHRLSPPCARPRACAGAAAGEEREGGVGRSTRRPAAQGCGAREGRGRGAHAAAPARASPVPAAEPRAPASAGGALTGIHPCLRRSLATPGGEAGADEAGPADKEGMKAVSFIWTRVGDVTHNYRESNNLFFLWIALVTEKLEILFNPSSKGRGRTQSSKRIAQGEGRFLLGQRGHKGESHVNISRQANQHVSQNLH
ncbi:elastin-like [Mustela erminea]|uniref:elastin-like n=1 Tax=Mustela erminea TaxID=36723 RepID=UPI001386C760|nr:elastin-like [Mustela erminea]